MYLFVSAEDSKDIHPWNTVSDFIVELSPMELKGKWSCALVECRLDKAYKEDLYVYCDLIQNSPIRGKMGSILRIIRKSREFSNPFYFAVSRQSVNRIRLSLKTGNGMLPDSSISSCVFALHLRKDTYSPDAS